MSTPSVTPEVPSGQDDWANAAQPAAPASSGGSSPAQPIATENAAPSTAKIPQQKAPDYQPPVVLTPQKRGGILGVVDSIADALTGATRPEIATDQQGNKYVKQQTLSHGQQWARIGEEAFRGAAAGLAAGKGAGNMGNAFEAGVQAGDKQAQQDRQDAQQMSATARQQNLDNANNQMLRMQMAEQAFRATRLQVEATQHDVQFAQGQVDRLLKDGGTVMGTMANPADISKIQNVNPDVMHDMIVKHQIEIMPNYSADGKRDGFIVVKMPSGYRSQILPAGSVFHTFDETTGKYVEHNSSDPMTAGERDDYEHAAAIAAQKFQADKTETALKQSEIDEHNANKTKVPSEIAKNFADAGEAGARTRSLNAGATAPDGTPNPKLENLAQALYDGDLLPSDLKREAKGSGIDPNLVEERAIELGKQKGHPWSASIIEQENKFASSPKTQAALDGIDRIIGSANNPDSGYMGQMLSMAQKADLGTWGAFNSVSLAIKRASGDTDAKNFHTAVSDTRRSIAGLIGNPLLGGSDSDKKLEQADEMLGQNPTLDNLRGAANLLTAALKTQRDSLIHNNRFLQKRYGGSQPSTPSARTTPAANPNAVQAGEPTITFPDGSIGVVRNGQWVRAAQ